MTGEVVEVRENLRAKRYTMAGEFHTFEVMP